MRWHLLTGEYPPAPGGVSDYTRLVARGLAASGDDVIVWTPRTSVGATDDGAGVIVQPLPDRFGPRSLARLTRALRGDTAPHRVLVQYVPGAFGWHGSNVPFCLWLRAQAGAPVWVMFHEVAYPIDRRQRLVLNGLGVVTRAMASLVAGAAARVFVSIPAWEPLVRRSVAADRPVEWLPVPNVIPVAPVAATDRCAVRQRYGGGRRLVGHLGTYGRLIRPLLADAVRLIIEESGANMLLLGRGSEAAAAECVVRHPALAGRLHGAGPLDAASLSQHISACDCLFQPYPDGVSSRRTSAMAVLAHARPLVTTSGVLTENLWGTTAGVVLRGVGDAPAAARACAAVLADATELDHRGRAALAFYESHFDVRHTLARLHGGGPSVPALRAAS